MKMYAIYILIMFSQNIVDEPISMYRREKQCNITAKYKEELYQGNARFFCVKFQVSEEEFRKSRNSIYKDNAVE